MNITQKFPPLLLRTKAKARQAGTQTMEISYKRKKEKFKIQICGLTMQKRKVEWHKDIRPTLSFPCH